MHTSLATGRDHCGEPILKKGTAFYITVARIYQKPDPGTDPVGGCRAVHDDLWMTSILFSWDQRRSSSKMGSQGPGGYGWVKPTRSHEESRANHGGTIASLNGPVTLVCSCLLLRRLRKPGCQVGIHSNYGRLGLDYGFRATPKMSETDESPFQRLYSKLNSGSVGEIASFAARDLFATPLGFLLGHPLIRRNTRELATKWVSWS